MMATKGFSVYYFDVINGNIAVLNQPSGPSIVTTLLRVNRISACNELSAIHEDALEGFEYNHGVK